MSAELSRTNTPASKILLVDDVEENLVALSALLRRPDVETMIAHSGDEALELVLQHDFALALVDVQMPEMNGFELAELMRGTEKSKYIPIIFVTAAGGDAIRIFRGYETGAVDFLFKPIDAHILKHKVDTFVRLDQQKQQLAAQYVQIQQSEALLRTIMDATQALIYVKDVHGNYITINKHYRDLLHTLPSTSRNASEFDLAPHIAESLKTGDARALAHGQSVQVEEHIEVDGASRTFLANKVPLRDHRDQVWGVCAVATDVTQMKQMESELERAVQAREDVLAVVSHDMRNFLQAIRSGVQLLLSERAHVREDMRNLIHERIKITVELMNRMISDLMDMTNIRVGRIALTLQTEVVASLIHDSMIVHEPLAQQKGIRLTSELLCPDDLVRCDRERVLQVLANLIGNALKFTQHGEIVIRTERDGQHVKVSVMDSGSGIESTDLPHVFDAYWSKSAAPQRGTGLGLYITKRIVEAHGAKIWIDSQIGSGTTVHFCLPLASVEDSKPRAAA